VTGPTRTLAKVLSNRELQKGIRRMELLAPRMARNSRAGQFVMVSASAGTAPLLHRPFSVHDRSSGSVSLLYRLAGLGTQLMAAADKGQDISVYGPLGKGFRIWHGRYRPIMVAGGIGLAPMPFLARSLAAKGLAPELLFGCRSKGEIIKTGNLRPTISTDDGSCGTRGPVTSLLEKALSGGGACRVYACGPWAMLRQVALLCRRFGVPCQVSLEARMACGVGACQGCSVRSSDGTYLSVCSDGPVFDSAMIDWEQEPPV